MTDVFAFLDSSNDEEIVPPINSSSNSQSADVRDDDDDPPPPRSPVYQPVQASDPYVGQLVATPQRDDEPIRPPDAPERRRRDYAMRRVARRLDEQMRSPKEHRCSAVSSDVPYRKAAEHWAEKANRVNILTHSTNVPCDMISLTRMRMLYEVLVYQSVQLVQQLGDQIEQHARTVMDKWLRAGNPTQITTVMADTNHFSMDSASTIAGQPTTLATHDSLDKSMALLGEGGAWKELRDTVAKNARDDTVAMSEFVDAYAKLAPRLASIVSTTTALERAERQLTCQMYPNTVADIYSLLEAHDVVCRFTDGATPHCALKVPSLGADDVEECKICHERDISKLYVRVMPRCTLHMGCIDERRAKKTCACIGKYFHLDCLAKDMLLQYRGDTNGGVGRTQLRCPTCRGSYCFADLVPFTVTGETAKPTASQSSATPSAKKRTKPSADDSATSTQQQQQTPVSVKTRRTQTEMVARMRDQQRRRAELEALEDAADDDELQLI